MCSRSVPSKQLVEQTVIIEFFFIERAYTVSTAKSFPNIYRNFDIKREAAQKQRDVLVTVGYSTAVKVYQSAYLAIRDHQIRQTKIAVRKNEVFRVRLLFY